MKGEQCRHSSQMKRSNYHEKYPVELSRLSLYEFDYFGTAGSLLWCNYGCHGMPLISRLTPRLERAGKSSVILAVSAYSGVSNIDRSWDASKTTFLPKRSSFSCISHYERY